MRFTFSGLDPETTYYARVTNASFGNIMTPVVAGTTAKAGPKASQNNPAQAGDIVLAQDFAAFIHGGDIVRSAAGYNAVSGTEFRKTWEPATGENPQADGDRPVCNWTTEFNVFTGGTSAEYIESVGMKGWGRRATPRPVRATSSAAAVAAVSASSIRPSWRPCPRTRP